MAISIDIILLLQFMDGWYVDFSNDFPSVFSLAGVIGYTVLVVHFFMGLLAGAMGVIAVILAVKLEPKVIKTSIASLVLLSIAGIGGIMFMITNFQNNVYSDVMLLGSILSLFSYFYLSLEA
ncbi:hypothetical protein [Sulfuracidifex tepidarius]|uniref:hypothetical protein n=1 Tax=Sulfuracidifex tepidarius TaxID=1294262 RepID=UPI0012E184D1|nr:hypothetical protein [Sulfuracidifex tepidarius]